ncbi:MAG TPA: helix-turn-helix domain-containing protein, partial [Planctomycetota bacterium]|nr:helix-turn-helix domain-containing protein [Planctomycetota bacterium]
MLRRVSAKDKTASEAARSFGFSRPSFYQAQSAFQGEGLFGLVPKKRGPRGGHKLTEEMLEFLRKVLAEVGPVSSQELAKKIQERFGVHLHRRTIERALGKKNYTDQMSPARDHRLGKEEEISGYEILRRRALGAREENGEGPGWSLLVNRGILAWLRAVASYAPVKSLPGIEPETGPIGALPVLGTE